MPELFFNGIMDTLVITEDQRESLAAMIATIEGSWSKKRRRREASVTEERMQKICQEMMVQCNKKSGDFQ